MAELETKIGRVVSVSGSQLICLLENPAVPPNSEMPSVQALEVGTIVKMRTLRSVVFGMVRAVSIPIPSQEARDQELKIAELELLGEMLQKASSPRSAFQRGVSFFPTLGEEVLPTTRDELRQIYACPATSNACIGYVHQDPTLPAYIKTDDLLGKHFAVLGTTGSGKSCAVTVILKAILGENAYSRILLLDPHNEYASAFGEVAQVLDPADSLELPHWLFNFEELCEVVIGGDELRSAQATLLAEAIIAAKLKFLANDASYPVTVDTPTPYWISDVISFLQRGQGKLERPEPLSAYMRLSGRLESLSGDSRFSFMFGRFTAGDKMAEILSRLFRIPVNGKPITIVDLSGIPSEILNVVVSVLCRMTLDFAMWSDRKLPILIVCEEAHRYAPRGDDLGFEPTKRALSRIAKEGRKYGVSLAVVTQRPSDLATEMLAECNTIFAMRMSNHADQELIRAALSESGLGLLEFLPSLRTGEAIVSGEGVPVPQRLSFSTLPANEMPRGKTSSFSGSWRQETHGPESVAVVVNRWRRRQKEVAWEKTGPLEKGLVA